MEQLAELRAELAVVKQTQQQHADGREGVVAAAAPDVAAAVSEPAVAAVAEAATSLEVAAPSFGLSPCRFRIALHSCYVLPPMIIIVHDNMRYHGGHVMW